MEKEISIVDEIPSDLDGFSEAVNDPKVTGEFFDVTEDSLPEVDLPLKSNSPRIVQVTKEKRLKVRMLKIAGISDADIAKCMNISVKALRKNFKTDIENGVSECTAMVAGKLMEKIQQGDSRSIIFYLSSRGGWSIKREIDVTHNHVVDPRNREEIIAELNAIGVPKEKMDELLEN
jgi:hypothetical protein